MTATRRRPTSRRRPGSSRPTTRAGEFPRRRLLAAQARVYPAGWILGGGRSAGPCPELKNADLAKVSPTLVRGEARLFFLDPTTA